MLLDLPAEVINLIIAHLQPPPSVPQNDLHRCHCLPQQYPSRQLLLYDATQILKAYETDLLHFALVDPYIVRCMASGGWHGVVDALMVVTRMDVGLVPCVPKEIRDVVRSINFSFCSIQYNRPPAEYLSPTSRATRQPRTIQEMLRQFPAARYLEIDLSRPELSDAVMDEMLNDRLHIMESGIPISSLPLISPEVTSIVLPSDRHLVRLAIAIPLPSLVRLHVSKEISVCDIPGPSQMLQFRSIFHEWQTIPALWPSLGSVQVCLRVLLAPSLDRLRLFNIWQTALSNILDIFRAIPSCKIGLCIAYTVDTGATLPFDYAFDLSPDGTCTPRGASAIRSIRLSVPRQ